MNRNKRPCPADFAEVAPTMCIERMVKHYHTSRKAVQRWLEETGAPCPSSNNVTNIARPMPEDFAATAPTMSAHELRRHYRTGEAVIKRWLKEAGVSTKGFSRKWNGGYKLPHGHFAQLRTHYTPLDEAADILRCMAPVYRCNPNGAANEKGDHWRYGGVVLTPDQLLARADRHRRKAA